MTRIFILALVCLITDPVYAADKDMTCAEITSELQKLNEIEAAAGDAALTNSVAGTGAAVATQGAIMSGAGSSVPFIGGLFNMGKAVTDHNQRQTAAAAENAEKRKIKLETIADIKNCL